MYKCILCTQKFNPEKSTYTVCEDCQYLRNGINVDEFANTCSQIYKYQLLKNVNDKIKGKNDTRIPCYKAGNRTHPLCKNAECIAMENDWSKFQYRMQKVGGDLKQNEWAKLIKQPCSYCGVCDCNGIDRKYNNKAYVMSNCIPCCMYCNFIKKDVDYDSFLKKIKEIANETNQFDNEIKGLEKLNLQTKYI